MIGFIMQIQKFRKCPGPCIIGSTIFPYFGQKPTLTSHHITQYYSTSPNICAKSHAVNSK